MVSFSRILPLLLLTLVVYGKSSTRFPWKTLDSVVDIDTAFGEHESSFNVLKNWKICNSVITDIPYSSDVPDFAPLINQELMALKKTGGAVRLGKGVYNISSAILLQSRTCLIGNGTSNTMLQVTDRAPAFAVKGVVYASKGEHVSVIALTINGNKNNQWEGEAVARTGAYFELINYAWFRNVASNDHLLHGYNMHGSDNRHASHVFFEGCHAERNNWAGFKLGSTNQASVFNSIAQGNGRAGIVVSTGATTTMLKSNRLWSNGFRGRGCGVLVSIEKDDIPTDTLIISNTIINSTHAGICLNTTNAVHAVRNKIENVESNDAYCYDMFDTRGLTIMETTCNVLSRMQYYPGPPEIAQSTHSATPSPSFSASPSVSPSPSTSTSLSATPWPSVGSGCFNGIANYNVCCRIDCEVCADVNCVGECCANVIIRNGRSCESNGPPCVLGSSKLRIPA